MTYFLDVYIFNFQTGCLPSTVTEIQWDSSQSTFRVMDRCILSTIYGLRYLVDDVSTT